MVEAKAGLNGLRAGSNTDSVLSTTFYTFGGTELYPSTTAKLARIAYDLVRNHSFLDGNKRIGDIIRMDLGLIDRKLSEK